MIKNKRLDDNAFAAQRKEVLAMWPTGKDVDLEEAYEYNRSFPDEKNVVRKARRAKTNGEIYCISGMGKSTVEAQIEKKQGIKIGYDTLVGDLYAVSKGYLV